MLEKEKDTHYINDPFNHTLYKIWKLHTIKQPKPMKLISWSFLYVPRPCSIYAYGQSPD